MLAGHDNVPCVLNSLIVYSYSLLLVLGLTIPALIMLTFSLAVSSFQLALYLHHFDVPFDEHP